jgi:hypothetical protein
MYGFLTRCTVISNTAVESGGGASRPLLVQNSVFIGNMCEDKGGALAYSRAVNSTFIRNSAPALGGGAWYDTTGDNCIFQDNSEPALRFSSCSNCFDGDPGFANPDAMNYSLLPDSPAINAGQFVYYDTGPVDRLGRRRVNHEQVDLGAYEHDGTVLADIDGDGLPDEWERTHGFCPLTPHNPLADSDGDGLSDIDELMTGTDPTDVDSALELGAPVVPGSSGDGIVFEWPSEEGRFYSLWVSTNLMARPIVFTQNVGGIAATPPLNIYTSSLPPEAGPFFYRVGVNWPAAP